MTKQIFILMDSHLVLRPTKENPHDWPRSSENRQVLEDAFFDGINCFLDRFREEAGMSVRDEYKKTYSAEQSDGQGRNNKVKKLTKYFCEGRAGNRLSYA